MDTLDQTLLETPDNPKERHGCVTAWLILMIVVNSITALVYLFASEVITDSLGGDISMSMILLLALLGILNVVFAVLLLKWNKIGFFGYIITAIIALIININIGISIGQSLGGLIGIGILFGILQITKNGVSAWSNMK